MRHYFLKAVVASTVILLVACQSATNQPGPVSHVFNFAPPPAQSDLTSAVQDALMRSGDPMIGQVRVQTVQSTVILSGYVKKIRQSDTAEQLARKVPGVTSVENHIIIRP